MTIAIVAVIFFLLAFVAWREYLGYHQNKKLFDLIDDLLDRKNAGDFERYAYGKGVKKARATLDLFDKQSPPEPETDKIKVPEFLNTR